MFMHKNHRYVRRYSENFKLKMLAELTKENHAKRQIALTYAIQSILLKYSHTFMF